MTSTHAGENALAISLASANASANALASVND